MKDDFYAFLNEISSPGSAIPNYHECLRLFCNANGIDRHKLTGLELDVTQCAYEKWEEDEMGLSEHDLSGVKNGH